MRLMTEAIVLSETDGVATVTLNRPASLNALDDAMTTGLLAYFTALTDRPDIRVVVLRGAGKAFCSGLDIQADLATRFVEGGATVRRSVQDRLIALVLAMRRCPQPILAVLQGPVAGGGFSLAMACDIRIAASDARMSAAFIRIGLSGGDMGSSYFLPRLIGAGPAAAFLLTGRPLGADQALALGFLAEVAPLDDLDAAAGRWLADLLATAPLALAMTKEVLNLNLDAPGLEAALALEARTQMILGGTGNFKGGVEAFRDRRLPRFSPAHD